MAKQATEIHISRYWIPAVLKIFYYLVDTAVGAEVCYLEGKKCGALT
jgi:hypothetical protein